MAGERGPKDEPSFDTQALLGVSDAELHEARGRRAPRRGPPKGLIAAAVGGVVVVIAGVVMLGRSGPEVVKVGPSASATPTPTAAPPSVAPVPAPSASSATVEPAPDPRASLPPVVVPVAEAEPERAPRPRDGARGRDAPRTGARAAGRPTGPDDVDRAMERLAKQSGDQHAAAGALEAARTAYAEECAAGRGASCTRWGALLAEGRGGARDEGGARDAFGQACRLRAPDGCLALARASEGRAALEALEAACDLASAAGCRGAAEYVSQSGGPEARVISLRARACALGDATSCDGARTSSGS